MSTYEPLVRHHTPRTSGDTLCIHTSHPSALAPNSALDDSHRLTTTANDRNTYVAYPYAQTLAALAIKVDLLSQQLQQLQSQRHNDPRS